MSMAPMEKELLNAIHNVDKNLTAKMAELETKIDDSVSGRFKDVERRLAKNESDIDVIKNDIKVIETAPHRSKAKWFDEVAKYILLALVAYLLAKAGLK